MADNNKMLQGQKILSIEDKNGGVNLEFISSIDKDTESARLRYYMWLARFFVFSASMAGIYMVLASLSLFRLVGLVSIEPYLVITFDKSENIVRTEPIATNMASKSQLMETFVKQYVILANTVINDPLEMRSRWEIGGMMHFLSAPDVFAKFYYKNIANLKKYQDQKLTREVEIISINKQGGEKSPVWKVDFKTNDLQSDFGGGDLIFTERFWTASITSYFIPERSFVGRRLINPIGFTVLRYEQSSVNLL